MPEGQDPSIHDQTPPVVDIPPIIQNEDNKPKRYLPPNSEDLFQEMLDRGIKFTKENVIALEKMRDGRIIFLEDAPGKGLDHIWEEHGAEFGKKAINREDMPLLLMKAIQEENIIGYQGKGYGRPIYSVEFQGEIVQVAISVGSNGFIVGANLNSKGK